MLRLGRLPFWRDARLCAAPVSSIRIGLCLIGWLEQSRNSGARQRQPTWGVTAAAHMRLNRSPSRMIAQTLLQITIPS